MTTSPPKTCVECGCTKQQKDFPMYRSANKVYYRRRCTPCWSAHIAQKRAEDWARAEKRDYGDAIECVRCHVIKPVSEFYENGPYLHKRCKPCFDENRKQLVGIAVRKQQCLEAYGRRCTCCGETEEVFLTFDHINEDGAEHRSKVRSGYSFYAWLIRNNFPDTIQILCFNCNWAKSRGGCPHQRAAVAAGA